MKLLERYVPEDFYFLENYDNIFDDSSISVYITGMRSTVYASREKIVSD